MVDISGHRPSLLELIKSYGEGPKATADLRGLLTETSTDPAIINPSVGGRPITMDKVQQGLSNIAELVGPGGRINAVGGTPRDVFYDSQPPRKDVETIAEELQNKVNTSIKVGRDTSNAALAVKKYEEDQAKDKVGTDTIMTSLLSSSLNDGYQPTTGWDRLFATLAGMGGRGSGAPIGTSGFNAFLGDFVGSSQDLATQEAKAATAQADRDILGEKLAGTQAYRDEGRAIEKQRLALAQKKDDRDKFGKAPNLNKNTIEGMEAILDASGLDYSALWDNVWDFLPGKDKGEKADARTAIASTALQIQITTPRLRGNPKEALRQAIENLSGGSAGQDPSVGPSISNAASVNIVN